MTRREEIWQQAGLHSLPWDDAEEQSKCEDIFVKGAQWADKTMIEKACRWLINIDFDDFHFRDCDETFNNDLFVDAFRKAMEE